MKKRALLKYGKFSFLFLAVFIIFIVPHSAEGWNCDNSQLSLNCSTDLDALKPCTSNMISTDASSCLSYATCTYGGTPIPVSLVPNTTYYIFDSNASNKGFCTTTYQCNDSIDNDRNGATDYLGGDRGCSSAFDNSESGGIYQCNDGIDNDGNGLTDYGKDPGCSSLSDDSEISTTSAPPPPPPPPSPSPAASIAYGVAVNSIGFYVVGYNNPTGADLQWYIERRNLDGTLWGTYSINPSSGNDVAYGVAVDSLGIYVVGYDSVAGNPQWRIERRSLDLRTTFWTKTINPSSGDDAATSVAIDSSGIYVVGFDSVFGNPQWRIEKRSLNDGSNLWTYTSNPSFSSDVAYGVAIDSSGIYVVGYDNVVGNPQWRIEKISLDGRYLWAYNPNPSSGNDTAYGVAIDSSGIYVVGYDSAAGLLNLQWRIEKISLDGKSTIWTQISNPSISSNVAYGVAIDSSGIYVVGYDRAAGLFDLQWRIEKRDLSTGALINNFGTSGVININPDIYIDVALGIAIDSNSLYVVGYQNNSSGYPQWHIEKIINIIPLYLDLGLRIFDGIQTIKIAVDPRGTLVSPLRISKNSVVYGVSLVDITDPNASKIRIRTSGSVKAIRKY